MDYYNNCGKIIENNIFNKRWEVYSVFYVWIKNIFMVGEGEIVFVGEGWEWGCWFLGLFLVIMLYWVCECSVSLNGFN